jgi:threonine dehydrogenase-like Zn-dependent dehydrogenase
MKTLKEKVAYWLAKFPHTRDDDNRLFANIWDKELEEHGVDRDIRKHILFLVAQGKLTPAPSIKRARAKLQEEYEEFRGTKYNKRQGVAQDKWKSDLKNFKNL